MAGIKLVMILTVAALNLPVMSQRLWADQFILYLYFIASDSRTLYIENAVIEMEINQTLKREIRDSWDIEIGKPEAQHNIHILPSAT